jgi:drug/metabolite transporter (DMT)-like permease
MSWLTLGLLSAMTISMVDILSKHVLKDTSFIIVGWGRLLFSAPFLIIASLFFLKIPNIDPRFWIIISILIPLEIIALLLYMKGLKLSPISLTIPFLSLTPIFLIITSFIMLNEFPSKSGILGILLISIGSYILNIHRVRIEDFLLPIKAIIKEKGPIFMIAVSFIYSITSNLGKKAIIYSSPEFMGIFYLPILLLSFTPILPFVTEIKEFRCIKSKIVIFLFIGFLYSIMILAHCLGISRIEVAYFIAIKRTSILFSVMLGEIFFKEGHIKERLIGTTLMVAGAISIYLGS